MQINHPTAPAAARIEAAELLLRTLIRDDRAEGKETAPLDTVYIVRAYEGAQELQDLCHGLAARSGWWTSRLTGKPLDRSQINVGEKLMLIVSEVAEAMEGDRKDLMDDKLPHRKMIEVELDLAGATIEKLAFNQIRADHKIENRNAPGGKAY